MIEKYLEFRKHLLVYLNYCIVLYVFTFPILSIYMNHQLFKNFGSLLAVLFILTIDIKKMYRLFIDNKLFQTVLLLVVLILLSFFWSEPHQEMHFYGQKSEYVRYMKNFFLFPFLIIALSVKKEFIPMIINAFLAAMFINELISFGIYFEFWSTLNGTPKNPISFHLNYITYSVFVGFAILLAIYKFFNSESRKIKSLYFIFLVTMVLDLFVSSGRTGQFALFITIIILTLIYFRKNIKKIFLIFTLLGTVFFISYLSIHKFSKRINYAINDAYNVTKGVNVDTSFGTRIMAWYTIPYLINKDNILLGTGIGDKTYYVKKELQKNFPYRLDNFDIHGFLHNSHLEILVSNGILGLSLYLMIFYYLIKSKIKDNFIRYMGYTLSIYFLCIGMTADIFFFHHITMLFSVFLAIVVAQKREEMNA